MNSQRPQRDPPARIWRILRAALLVPCLALTVWTLAAKPPQLELWPALAFLAVVAAGIVIPVGLERKHGRTKRHSPPLQETPETPT